MAQADTTERIIRTLRSAEKPALSAADIAEKLDVSVKTVNNNLKELIDKGDVETTPIGNATAYYISDSDIPAHQKPDHSCARCGREASNTYDLAKIELDTYFSKKNLDPGTTDFYVLCRFCHADLVAWLYRDDGSIGGYPDVHSWDIPEKQLQEVRDNPEAETAPDEPSDYDDDYKTIAFQVFETLYDEPDQTVAEQELREALEEELPQQEAENGFKFLENGGYFARTSTYFELLPAK